jgi:LysM repeat protein
LLPAAAVPALAGMAASVCLAPQALADQAPARTAAHSATTAQSATVDAAVIHVGMTPAELISAAQRAAGQASAKARPTSYTVRSGDSLSSIAGRVYHKQNAWPVLYWANHSKIRWANIISEGQVLKVPALPAKIPAAPSQLGPVAPAPVAAAPVSGVSESAPVQATTATSSSYSGGAPGGSFGACVIARESGGNAQVMNSSGHYGLYQFSASTWEAYGGSAADFGHASVAEQNRVFANALAQGGQSNWSPYDGC